MIKIKGLNLHLDGFSIENIDLEVWEGEYFFVVGPNGSGKTTLLECIAGLRRPREGDIWIEGKNVTKLPPEKRRVGYVPQDYALFPHLTVYENITFGLKEKRNRKDEMEDVVELTDLLAISHLAKRNTEALSGGEKQKVSLARALAIRPKLLLLDEPFSALDSAMRHKLWWELKKIHRNLGVTIIHITQNFQEALALADRVGVLHEGRMVQVGTPEEIFRRPKTRFVAEFVEIENIFRGRCLERVGSSKRIGLEDGIEIWACTEKSGEVFASISPEEVLLTKDPVFQDGTRNRFKGRVHEILNRGVLFQVVLDIGVHITSLVTRRQYFEMDLNIGSEIYVSFREDGVYVF